MLIREINREVVTYENINKKDTLLSTISPYLRHSIALKPRGSSTLLFSFHGGVQAQGVQAQALRHQQQAVH